MDVTFLVLNSLLHITFKESIMKNLKNKYEKAKASALKFMQNGQINAYLNALVEMNKYKTKLIAIKAS